MTQQSLHYKTLSEVAARIAEGNLDSAGVTEALLERIEALEPKLHSCITVLGEQALGRARRGAGPSSRRHLHRHIADFGRANSLRGRDMHPRLSEPKVFLDHANPNVGFECR
jgi:hypothetical protein